MRYTLWDNNSPVHGIDPDQLRQSYPVPPGGRLLVVEADDGGLVMVQPTVPGVGGHVPITEDNLADVKARLDAQLTPPAAEDAAPTPPGPPTDAPSTASPTPDPTLTDATPPSAS